MNSEDQRPLFIYGHTQNGGVYCDTPEGPCACGAWHHKDDWSMVLGKKPQSELQRKVWDQLLHALEESARKPAPGYRNARIRATREIEVEFKGNKQAIRVLINGKAMPIRSLVVKRQLPSLEQRVFPSVLDLLLDIELVNGERFVIHTWTAAVEPPLKPVNSWKIPSRLYETEISLEECLEPEAVDENWHPVRLYDFEDGE